MREGGWLELCFLDLVLMIGGYVGNMVVEKMIFLGFFGVCVCVFGRFVVMGEIFLF